MKSSNADLKGKVESLSRQFSASKNLLQEEKIKRFAVENELRDTQHLLRKPDSVCNLQQLSNIWKKTQPQRQFTLQVSTTFLEFKYLICYVYHHYCYYIYQMISSYTFSIIEQ